MLTDALGKSGGFKNCPESIINKCLYKVAYITALIFELLQANYTNNISANEHFLDNMYRIVSISLIMGTVTSCTLCRLAVAGHTGRRITWVWAAAPRTPVSTSTTWAASSLTAAVVSSSPST